MVGQLELSCLDCGLNTENSSVVSEAIEKAITTTYATVAGKLIALSGQTRETFILVVRFNDIFILELPFQIVSTLSANWEFHLARRLSYDNEDGHLRK